MNTNRNFSARADGAILIFVLVVATIIGGATFALLQYANAGLLAQRVEKDNAQALSNAFSGLEIARNAADTSNYADYSGENHNVFLWTKDSTADGVPGASPFVLNGVSTVTVSYLGYSWYELLSTATVGDVTRIVKLRVREKDYYARYGTFVASSNEVTIEDNASLYGSVHANGKIVFEDDITGVGAKCYGLVTSTNNFTFNKNADTETNFYAGYADNLGYKIDMPTVSKISNPNDATDPNTLKGSTGAWGADGTLIYSNNPGNPSNATIKFGSGPGGFSIIGNVDAYIEFINSDGNRKKVKITIKDGATTKYTGTLDVPQGASGEGGVIHVGSLKKGGVSANIAGIKGELDGRVTVCCESSISISADLVYEDGADNKAMLFDPNDPRTDNYLPNENYTGTSALGIIAAKDILYTGSEDDANLEVNAAMIALKGDIKSGTADKGYLRTFGSRCAYGKIEPCTSGHGYLLSAVHIYDEQGCVNPAPQFPSLNIPYYTGLEVVK
jgi:hypothetical protein